MPCNLFRGVQCDGSTRRSTEAAARRAHAPGPWLSPRGDACPMMYAILVLAIGGVTIAFLQGDYCSSATAPRLCEVAPDISGIVLPLVLALWARKMRSRRNTKPDDEFDSSDTSGSADATSRAGGMSPGSFGRGAYVTMVIALMGTGMMFGGPLSQWIGTLRVGVPIRIAAMVVSVVGYVGAVFWCLFRLKKPRR